MTGRERQALIEQLEGRGQDRRQLLESLKVPESTYYYWRKLYREGGPLALDKEGKTVARKVWNKLTGAAELLILRVAREQPELSPGLIGVKIPDEEEFYVSASTVLFCLPTLACRKMFSPSVSASMRPYSIPLWTIFTKWPAREGPQCK